ncbi:RHD3-domain-containing protein [Rozella allomycis CSF55]|uniref:RHD3-domain-containing protein n=1 Tax=Rozella allomycis (strain CSF55) TaxID=988480 RepID=A0A4P9YHH5_ROZAC|nr:RHD3-domain-containing protein [Rozella allomycis CSF55]
MTNQIQLINDEQKFNQNLESYVREKWQIGNFGFDYTVVAVFGAQSTGKSTLLNRLFGTAFQEMDDTRRQQTTKGTDEFLHSVGLYNGASMGLLKTVFEVHLQLFQQPGDRMAKKLLLFVIRDFEGSTPLINLENTLRSDLDRIWRGLSKVRFQG